MLGRDSSPLLSALGIVALASAAASACSDNKGGPAPIDDVADVVDVGESINEFYCECYGELYGYDSMDVQACLSELNIISDEERACLTEVFDAKPAEFEVLRCQAEAQRGLLSCSRAEGCGESFTCDDGAKVPENYVCDGDSDCEDGSDEQESCPAPFMCEDGIPLEDYSVCDGFEDCAGGEDENACPAPFVCGDGSELPPDWVCDEALDCEDGSDEQQSCPVTCTSGYFMQLAACGELSEEVQRETSGCLPFVCPDGSELSLDQRCDGTPDCPNGEDEQSCEPSDPAIDCSRCDAEVQPDASCHSEYDAADDLCICDPGYIFESSDPAGESNFACERTDSKPPSRDCGSDPNNEVDELGRCVCVEGWTFCTPDLDDLSCCEV